MIESQAQLDRQREELIQELIDMQPFRRGTLNHGVYRKCGKKTCVCTQAGHPGHGPIITLTHKKENKTKTRKINPVRWRRFRGRWTHISFFWIGKGVGWN